MLSILIPVYNQNVVDLVKSLQSQCESLDLQFQILVFDDKSNDETRKENKSLANEFGVNYVELAENIGRAKIRNRLGSMAQFKNLLFLDGDSKVIRDDFISSYLEDEDRSFLTYGGREYQKEKPKDQKLILHWKYGVKREARDVNKRRLDPYLNFQSNNFMVKSHVFKTVQFDEEVKGYGYEDLLYAEKLKELNVSVMHIDNPVLHDGLETAEQFISKTKNAVKNLVTLNKDGYLLDVRLSRFYKKMEDNRLLGLLLIYAKRREQSILQNLKESSNPSIRNFSFFKLLEYSSSIKDKV
jgi:glycosyltransferase involved in cell wall biosynthesis